MKPLVDGSFAVCLFNKASTETKIDFDINEIINKNFVNMNISQEYLLKDLWNKEEFTVYSGFSAAVPGHGIRLFKVTVK